MPKETIAGNPDDYAAGHVTHVHVGWHRSDNVQVGLQMPLKSLTFVNINPGTGEHEPLTEVFDSVWVDLNRDQINRLIRTLRKARDAAFGADA